MTRAVASLSPDRSGIEIAPGEGSANELAGRLRALHPGLRTRSTQGRLWVSFFEAARLLPETDDLRWLPDAEKATENRRRIREDAPRVRQEAETLRAMSPTELRRLLPELQTVVGLDDHQLLNVGIMSIPGGWGTCIFDEQGTGKTPTVIAAFDVLVERNEAEVLLVVAPKSMIAEWGEEFRRFAGETYKVAVIEGSRQQRTDALNSGADVVVVNYEGAASLSDDLRLLTLRSRVVLVVDESFNVKNPDAARTAAIADLRETCDRCYVLCGTPAPNAPADLMAQVNLVDFGLTFDGLPTAADPNQHRGHIQEALRERGLFSRNLKAQVLPDLPSRTFAEVRLEFEPEQRRLYLQALDGLVDDLRGINDSEFSQRRMAFGERRSALLRLCSHPGAVAPRYAEIPAKIKALDQLLTERVGQQQKVVLWSFYRYTLDVLAERYAQYGVARIDGSVADVPTRRDAVRRFQNDDETWLFLGNPAAAGAGLTLHRAAVAIYESFSNQAAHFMQSLDRIHRRGQNRDVEYVLLLCDGSVEEPEYDRILQKVDAQADLLGDPEPARMTRNVMLSELVWSRDRLES